MFVPHSLLFWSYEFERHEVVRCSECLFGPIQARRFAGCIASWRRVCKVVDDRRSVRVLWICPVAFLVRHCDRSFFPQAESNGILFDDQVEELMHHRYCFFRELL